jgi:hypothetical protein
MAANSEVVRGRDPVRLPAWVVIGVALALTGALTVVSLSERDTVPSPSSGSATITQGGSGSARAVEMAELKTAVAHRFSAEQRGTTTVSEQGSIGARSDIEMAELKTAVGQRFLAEQHGTHEPRGATEPTVSYGADNSAPVMIDGELCGQCR